jgi:myo-inositol-1(or 4)-monophosphatase
METRLMTEPGMLAQIVEAVKAVAASEIMPRYLTVAQHRKVDGTLVTAADVAAQRALTLALIKICPAALIGEEMTEAEQWEQWLAGDSGLWCVDPIDGTTNFCNGVPYFGVSVALMRNGRSELGVVYDPVADEVFCAARGRGAYLNGEPLPIKERAPTLRGAMANVDFKRLNANLKRALAESPPYGSQRNFGASSLEWCYVAAGRFDLYLHGSQKLWDYAAGSLILKEAGGLMCQLESDDFWSGKGWQRSVIAGLDSSLFEQWKVWLRARA